MRDRIRPLTVLIVSALLVLAGITMAMPAAAQAFHGDVKIHQDPGESEPVDRNNEPKLCATAPYSFHIHGNGFDLSATGWWAIYDDWSGTTKHVALDGHWATTATSDSWMSTSLALPDGHYKLEYDYDSDASGNAKSKVFKLDCPAIPGNGAISVLKYNDLNASGSQQGNEPGLQGWSFTVKNAQNETAGTIQTGAGGEGTLGVPPGTYTVIEVQQTGWDNTEPGGLGQYTSVVVGAGETTYLDFGNHQAGSPTPTTPTPTPTTSPTPTTPSLAGTLRVTKYNDTDRDGARDGNEPGLANWSFQVKSGPVVLATLVTDANGVATMSLVPGTYTVSEIMQTGWLSTDPTGATPTKTVTVSNGQLTGVLFGNAIVLIPATTQTQIVIEKYQDTNANGNRDGGEGTLAGFSFTVRSSDGAIVRTAVTGDAGTAVLLDLPLGTYTITEEPRTGWTNTDPGASARKTVTLTSSATSVSVAFGNAQVRLPSTSTLATDDGTTGAALALVLLAALLAGCATARRIMPTT